MTIDLPPVAQPAPPLLYGGPLPPSLAATLDDDRPDTPPTGTPRPEAAVAPVRRRTRIVRPQRAMAVVAVVALVAVATIPVLVAWGVRTIANSKEGRTSVLRSAPRAVLPSTPAALLVVTGSDGAVVGLTLLAVAPSGSGGGAIIIPVGTQVTGSSAGPRVGDAFRSGGLDAQAAAIEGLFGVTLSAKQVVDRAGLEALLEPAGSVSVTLKDPVVGITSSGKDELLVGAGVRRLVPADAAAVLAAAKSGETELARLPRTSALWSALIAQRTGGDAASSTTAPGASTASTATTTLGGGPEPPPDVAGYLGAIRSGPAVVVMLSVTPAPAAGPDVLAPNNIEIRLLAAELMPGSVSPAGEGARIRILNPTGDPAVLSDAAGAVVYLGFNLVVAGPTSGPVPARTQLEYHNDKGRGAAEFLTGSLGGSAEVVPSELQVDGLDLTVTLGEDFVRQTLADRAARTTTTAEVTTVPTTITSTTVKRKP